MSLFSADPVLGHYALELFESAMPQVLAEVRRVLRSAGRVGVVAMAETGQSNAMTIVYNWIHRRWPHIVDGRPIDLTGALQAARFQTRVAAAATISGLPVGAAIGLKAVDKDGAGRGTDDARVHHGGELMKRNRSRVRRSRATGT